MNEWTSADHALAYLARADHIPHRTEGEAVLLEIVPRTASRVLDLGTGNGRLIDLLKIERPDLSAVGLDISPAMLQAARQRFQDDPHVEILEHDFDDPLPDLGVFDAVVSSFAIHHCTGERVRLLYAEIFQVLAPGGIFCNLEHVASPTARLHRQFYELLGQTEDPSNKLVPLGTHLGWLEEAGFADVDCLWKWRELALLVGIRP